MEILSCFIDFIKRLVLIILNHSDDIIFGIIGSLIFELIIKKAL